MYKMTPLEIEEINTYKNEVLTFLQSSRFGTYAREFHHYWRHAVSCCKETARRTNDDRAYRFFDSPLLEDLVIPVHGIAHDYYMLCETFWHALPDRPVIHEFDEETFYELCDFCSEVPIEVFNLSRPL